MPKDFVPQGRFCQCMSLLTSLRNDRRVQAEGLTTVCGHLRSCARCGYDHANGNVLYLHMSQVTVVTASLNELITERWFGFLLEPEKGRLALIRNEVKIPRCIARLQKGQRLDSLRTPTASFNRA